MAKARLGLVLDKRFHQEGRWVSALTPRLVEALQSRFDCCWIENQRDYEAQLGDLDALLSMEPGWAAPRLDFARTAQLRAKLASIPSYIMYSDPHDNAWREDYFLNSGLGFVLAYFWSPTFYHFRRLPPGRVVHFPWSIPDDWLSDEPVRFRGQTQLLCFGAAQHEAYAVRNWCRGFPFVASAPNSGVENKVVSDADYLGWLASHDAAIAAGTDDPRYRLTVPKYFEIAAAGSLLFAQETDDLARLGFEHSKNCIVFNRANFEALATDYLAHPADYLDIRAAGRELIRSRHRMSMRLDLLEQHIEERCGARAAAKAVSAPAPLSPEPSVEDRDARFAYWFERICIPAVLDEARRTPLFWDDRPLAWDVAHEIFAFARYSGGRYAPSDLVALSNNRYRLLDEIWPGGQPDRAALDTFYMQSAAILPWGHGVFLADHDVEGRRENWLRRVDLLKALRARGVQSLVDYGAGGGHTSLIAWAMGFERVVHHEYGVFHPFVAWRAQQIEAAAPERVPGLLVLTDAIEPLALEQPVDAVLCMDVPEHVGDPQAMLREIHAALKPDGLLVWVAMFEDNISCHLHGHLRGQEEALLRSCGFERVSDLPVAYSGHCGLYRRVAVAQPRAANLPGPVEPADDERPRVLFVVDAPRWAHDLKTDNLARHLQASYRIDKRLHSDISETDLDRADLIVVYYWLQLGGVPQLAKALERNRHKLLIGVCSNFELEGEWREPGLSALHKARTVFVNNLAQYQELARLLDVPVFYTPNGVDTGFYTPADAEGARPTLRVGWAGSLHNHGNKRGYHDFIVPAVARLEGVELITAAREEHWRGPEQMREFYRSLDAYVCASREEGTPNPCLEAAACGVPLVTTRVGNMPELIEHGVNGLFVERDVADIVAKLRLLRDNVPLRRQMGRAVRESIESWDWKVQAGHYRAMFDAVLRARTAPVLTAAPRLLEHNGHHAVVELDTLRFELDTRRYLDRELAEGRLWEPEATRLLARHVRSGMTVLDVGANFGYYAALFSRWVGASGRVLAFEPVVEYRARLERHVQENRLVNVAIVPLGLSDSATERDIYVGECSATMHWIASGEPRAVERVRLERLDDWWARHVAAGHPDRIDLIKADLDGDEGRFLAGARGTLTRLRPLLLLEFSRRNFEKAGSSCAAVADLLERDLGYVLCREGDAMPYAGREQLLAEVDRTDRSANVLCVPRERAGAMTHNAGGHFSTPAELYLASADRMDCVLANLERLAELPSTRVETYATVIGGLSGLNYLLRLDPQRVVFFDVNLTALDYARLIVELIALSDSHADFIGRIFGRPVAAFRAANGNADLSVGNQDRYLAVPVDPAVVADTIARLSEAARRTYQAFVVPFHAGTVLEGARNCRRLLPCWPIDERVPVGGGQALGCDEAGRLVPNTNTFFYGHGWLASQAAFERVQRALAQAQISFVHTNLLTQDLRALGDLAAPFVLHVSNIDDWFPDAWQPRVDGWVRDVARRQGQLTLISSHNGVGVLRLDPHTYAFAGIAPYVFGRVVEVTHKLPWGFHEFERTNVTVEQYLAGTYPADTTILHILVGEGMPRETVVRACERALRQSARVIVLEHNRDSVDWRGAAVPLLSCDELLALCDEASSGCDVSLTHVGLLAGEGDAARNVMVVLDRLGAPTVEPEPRHDLPVSFCIITAGQRPQILTRVIASIHAQSIPDYEIVVAGKHHVANGIRYLPMAEAAQAGRLGALRNAAVAAAQHENIVILDDDIVLAPDWYERLCRAGGDFDILTSQVRLPDGTRYWDHATCGGPRGHQLLAPHETDAHTYMTGGGGWVMKRRVANGVRWREDLGFYESEDVDFAHRCHAAGFRVEHRPACVVYHADATYTSIGRSVFRRAEGRSHEWVRAALGEAGVDEILAAARAHAREGRTAEAADCLRYGLECFPHDDVLRSGWEAFQTEAGGVLPDTRWSSAGDPAFHDALARQSPAVAKPRRVAT
jgi:FkbM family methyltransferase